MSADAVVTAFMTSLFFLLGLSEARAEKLPRILLPMAGMACFLTIWAMALSRIIAGFFR